MTAIDLHAKCPRCGHAWSFHGKAVGVQCKAMGCKGGPDGKRCPGFIVEPEQPTLSAST